MSLKRKAPDNNSTFAVGSHGLQIRWMSRNVNTDMPRNDNSEQQHQHDGQPPGQENMRPIRSNHGQGGHLEQVQKYITTAAQKQSETSHKSSSHINTIQDIPPNLAENPNAPPLKKARNGKKPVSLSFNCLLSSEVSLNIWLPLESTSSKESC